MGSMILFTAFAVLIAAFILGTVAIGMEGKGKEEHPRVAHTMARAAQVLNGDAELPRSLQKMFN